MTNRLAWILAVPLSVAPALDSWADDPATHPLVEQARKANERRYKYALDEGAKVLPTADGKSFYVLWLPESGKKGPPPILATIHGHGSWAFDEFFLWHRAARERGFGVLAIQWWLGKGERYQDYLSPEEVYAVVEEVFEGLEVKSGTALFHGFSRGSADSYAVAASDTHSGNRYFGLFVANSGKPGLDFPSNVRIENGDFGEKPLTGTHWVTYAGAKDPNPDRDGCEGMRAAAEWVRKQGGVIDLAIEDPEGGHGGFHRNPKNIDKALDCFEKRLPKGK